MTIRRARSVVAWLMGDGNMQYLILLVFELHEDLSTFILYIEEDKNMYRY